MEVNEAGLDARTEALRQLDHLLAGLVDFHGFSGVLTHDDPQVQWLVERTVNGVAEARRILDDLVPADTGADTELADESDLPAEIPPDHRIEPGRLEQITMANPTGMRELVLIADHDAAGLADMEGMLTGEDYRVLSVRDGFKAISIYGRLWAAIDLVILDFSLPGMSGDLVFDELQAINPKVAVVVSSGFTHPEKLKQMLAQGLSGFLPKPYERERLLRQIQQVLAHRPGMGH